MRSLELDRSSGTEPTVQGKMAVGECVCMCVCATIAGDKLTFINAIQYTVHTLYSLYAYIDLECVIL